MSEKNDELLLCNLFNVSNKVALVTGGSSGIGKIFITSRNVSRLKTVTNEINSKFPDSVKYIVSDLRTKKGVEDLIRELQKCTTKLHILINNSAMTWADPIDSFDEKRGWDMLYAVNVKAPFYLSVLLSPIMTASANGNIDPARIINISSIGSLMFDARAGAFFRPKCGIWSYCTSKAALNHLTMVLANEYTKKNININTVTPGIFKSKMTAQGLKHWPERMKTMMPNGRYGKNSDIVGVIIFLCSKASSHVTGSSIILDGGSYVGSSTVS